MPPVPYGNRSQMDGDAPTQLLAPVGHRDGLRRDGDAVAGSWRAVGGALQAVLDKLPPIPDNFEHLPEAEKAAFRAELETALSDMERQTAQRVVDDWQATAKQLGAANWILDRAALTAPYRLGYGFGPKPADETAVIPKTPAQPEAEWDKPELPDCKKRSTAVALLVGAGVLAGVPIGMALSAVLFMWKVLAP